MHLSTFLAAFGLATVSVFAQAAPAARLDVRLSVATPVFQGDVDVPITVTVTNPSRSTVTVLASQLPGDDLETNLFKLVREKYVREKYVREKEVAPYLGALAKRKSPTAAELVQIAPGATLTYQFELSAAYDLSQNGMYTIEYVGLDKHGGHGASTAPLYIWLEGRTAKATIPAPVVGAAGLSFSGNCSASQQTTIASAVSAATSYAVGAATYLGGSPSATARYTTWFGAFDATRWATVKSHFNAEVDAFQNKPVTVDCKCKKSNVYAYVYPTQPYKIYVCGAFWAAPMTGTDSKAGTLIHEMSHFNVVASTDDWAYGQTNAKALAISDPVKAVDNADSHEYFAENTPALP